MSKPCEYCGHDLPFGVDKKTRQLRSHHFASCEVRLSEKLQEAALEAKDEPVAWSEDFDAMPFNTYCKAIVNWYSHSRDGDSFLEGRDVEVIVVKYESGKGEYNTVFIHEGNKQYAYTRCEVSKWKPLYTTPPQRTWVGLTAHERMMCRSYDVDEAIANTENKLKEKNT